MLVLTFALIKSVQVIHRILLKNVLHFPMVFYETTPTGRILQRFSNDLNTIEDRLLWAINFAIRMALQVK